MLLVLVWVIDYFEEEAMQEQRQNEEILDPELLLAAYCAGYFPMAESKDGPIHWFSPDPRGILELDEFRVPRSLRQTIRKQKYEIKINSAFEDVMRHCGDREETWISESIVQSYSKLHQLGYAHSVESWYSNRLVGGLYGVAIGGAFFGESMFSIMSDASKVCLVVLVNRMKERGFTLLDVQYVNPHLLRFGAKEIPRSQYLERLQHAIKKQCSFL